MKEILKQILSEIKDVKEDVTDLKKDVVGLKEDVTGLKKDVVGLKEDVTNVTEGQGRIETKVDNLSFELSSHFKYTNDKLDEHRKVFGIVSDEMKGMKVDIDYLSSKTGKHDTELNNIMNRLKG
ncbi:hypothetical protein ACIQ4Z_17480 [Peribacillus asahii]|uniref:hypothetical protein n=1 Tax=Peribacillus asahii TaxID=228899 RepID=UPI003806087F